jgi:hypothetical protein
MSRSAISRHCHWLANATLEEPERFANDLLYSFFLLLCVYSIVPSHYLIHVMKIGRLFYEISTIHPGLVFLLVLIGNWATGSRMHTSESGLRISTGRRRCPFASRRVSSPALRNKRLTAGWRRAEFISRRPHDNGLQMRLPESILRWLGIRPLSSRRMQVTSSSHWI